MSPPGPDDIEANKASKIVHDADDIEAGKPRRDGIVAVFVYGLLSTFRSGRGTLIFHVLPFTSDLRVFAKTSATVCWIHFLLGLIHAGFRGGSKGVKSTDR